LVNHTWFLRRQTFVPADVFDDFGCAEVPKLQLFVGLVGACKEIAIVDVDGITTNIRLKNRSDGTTWSTHVPNHDGVVPTSGNNMIGIVGVELAAENSVAVTWGAGASAFEGGAEGS